MSIVPAPAASQPAIDVTEAAVLRAVGLSPRLVDRRLAGWTAFAPVPAAAGAAA